MAASFTIYSANVIVGNESISTHAFKSLAPNTLTIGPRDNVNGTIAFLADVGVHTLDPASALHVAGNVTIDDSLSTANIVASNSVTAALFSGSGASLTTLNADNVSTGILVVERGGTGVDTSTGSGNNVLANSATMHDPTFTGTVVASAITTPATVTAGTVSTTTLNASGTATAALYNGSGAGLTNLNAANIASGTLLVTRGGTGVNSSTGSGNNVLANSATMHDPTFTGTVVASAISTPATITASSLVTTTFNASGTATAALYNGSGAGLTNLNAAQLTSGTVPDALITGAYTGLTSLTASGTVTAGTFSGSGASLTSLNMASASTGTLAVARGGTNTTTSTGTGSVVLSTAPTLSGTVTISQTSEPISLITGATGVVSHDYAVSAIFHHSSMVASFTCNLTNIPTTTSRTIIVALVLIQGTTAYMCTALQIAGVAQTIRWANGIVPTGTASKTDIVTFTLIRASSAWTVLGQNQVYG